MYGNQNFSFLKLVNNHILIAIDSNKLIHVLEVKANHLVKRSVLNFHFEKDEYCRTVEYAAQDQALVVGRKNGVVEFVDLATQEVRKRTILPLSNDYFAGWGVDIMTLSPDKRWLTVGQVWYTIYPINLEDLSVTESAVPGQPLQMQYNHLSNLLAIVHGEQGGTGLVIYEQRGDGSLAEVFERWGARTFQFSGSSNSFCIFSEVAIYTEPYSGQMDKEYYYLTAKHYSEGELTYYREGTNGFRVDWKYRFQKEELVNIEFDNHKATIRIKGAKIYFAFRKSVYVISEPDGTLMGTLTASSDINDFIFDNSGTIWVATDNGIDSVGPQV